jgi:hypothetical protein
VSASELSRRQDVSKSVRLEHTINAQAHAAEMRIAEILGQRRLAQLRRSLELLAGATNDDEV